MVSPKQLKRDVKFLFLMERTCSASSFFKYLMNVPPEQYPKNFRKRMENIYFLLEFLGKVGKGGK
jgi:hypothetical protein